MWDLIIASTIHHNPTELQKGSVLPVRETLVPACICSVIYGQVSDSCDM